MRLRTFGGDPAQVSEVGLGCWQIGGDQWGDVPDGDALLTLRSAVENGISFFDTADVYGSGRSEELIGQFLRERPGRLFVATKLGRFPQPGMPMNFQPQVMKDQTEASLHRLGVSALDLTQLHCVPLAVLKDGEVFETLRELKRAGKIKRFGASVESIEEANVCLEQEGLASLQIIFNIFRQSPAAELMEKAQKKGVAIIVRLPLASGLLTGKFTKSSTFSAQDHRSNNRNGEKFNVGETFAGLPFEKGLELTERLRALVPPGYSLAEAALRWCLDFSAVSVIIPGARNPAQAKANAAASRLPSLPAEVQERLRRFFRDEVKPHVRGPD